jgi:O-antigen/teichoic acid export membrane protein
MTRDLVWTTLTSGAILLGNIVLANLLAQRGATEVFGPYQLAKRVGASVMPVVSIGLGLGVVKSLASSTADEDRDRFTVVGVAVLAAVLVAVTALLLLAPAWFSRQLLGSVDVPLMWAMWAYTVALTLNTQIYSFHRGEFHQTRANWNTLVAMTLAPVVVVLVAPAGWDAVPLLASVSVVVIAWNGTQLLVRMFGALRRPAARTGLTGAARSMITYSASRVPGSVAMSFILAVGALVATRAGEALTASYVLAGMTLVQVAGASLQAFGVVLMPRIAELDTHGNTKSIRNVSGRLLFIGTSMSLLIVPLLWTIAPDLTTVWLGPEFAAAVPAMRITSLGIPAVLFISVLRGVLDATIRQPVITYASVAGLVVCAAGSLAVSPADSVAISIAFVVGQAISAAVMLGVLIARFRPSFHPGYHLAVAAGSLAAAAVVTGIGGTVGDAAPYARIASALLLGGVALGATVWFAPADTGLRERALRVLGRVR